jgi:hypothetical protein
MLSDAQFNPTANLQREKMLQTKVKLGGKLSSYSSRPPNRRQQREKLVLGEIDAVLHSIEHEKLGAW